METLFQDTRFALRGLLKRPAFTAVAVITLALGIGANTSIFSVVYAVLLSPLPYRQPDKLVTLFAKNEKKNLTNQPMSYPNFNDLREQNQVFDQLIAVRASPSVCSTKASPSESMASASLQASCRCSVLNR